MERLRPDDDFMFRLESDATPMQIGALHLFERSPDDSASFYTTVRAHIEKRLPFTPLLRVVRHAPFMFDTACWFDITDYDPDYHIRRVGEGATLSLEGLHRLVEEESVRRIDLARPPFEVHVIERLENGNAAVFWKVHHSICDGIAFQNMLGIITDPTPVPRYKPPPQRKADRPTPAPLWLLKSGWRFFRSRLSDPKVSPEREQATAALAAFAADPANVLTPTPTCTRSGHTHPIRRFQTISLSLGEIKETGKRLGGTVNDVFSAIATTAIRRYLLEVGDLPEGPLVAGMARSCRDEQRHGKFGNRLIPINPSLATDIEDPLERFFAAQASVAKEIRRSDLQIALLTDQDVPFGARKRQEQFEALMASGKPLPGNVTLSNVPGHPEPLYLAGHKLLANYPAPAVPHGKIINFTLRRYQEHLDLAIMADGEKIPDLEKVKVYINDALEELRERSFEFCADVGVGDVGSEGR